jgi:nicotinate-nucleotide pyrophosphorylase
MSKFRVYCSETVTYMVEVEAESAEQAEELVGSGAVDLGDPVDGDNFQIDEISEEELENA